MSFYPGALSRRTLSRVYFRVCSVVCVAGMGTGLLAFIPVFFSAETFVLGSPITFNAVEWYGGYAPTNSAPATDAFTITFFDTTAGVPNATPIAGLTFNVGNNVNRAATGLTIGGSTEYAYSSVLPGSVNLAAGTYGISIVNDTSSDADDDWLWETTEPITVLGHYFRRAPDDPWSSEVDNLSFRLLNVTASAAAPEPGSLALPALTGLPVVGVVIRRRRRVLA